MVQYALSKVLMFALETDRSLIEKHYTCMKKLSRADGRQSSVSGPSINWVLPVSSVEGGFWQSLKRTAETGWKLEAASQCSYPWCWVKSTEDQHFTWGRKWRQERCSLHALLTNTPLGPLTLGCRVNQLWMTTTKLSVWFISVVAIYDSSVVIVKRDFFFFFKSMKLLFISKCHNRHKGERKGDEREIGFFILVFLTLILRRI